MKNFIAISIIILVLILSATPAFSSHEDNPVDTNNFRTRGLQKLEQDKQNDYFVIMDAIYSGLEEYAWNLGGKYLAGYVPTKLSEYAIKGLANNPAWTMLNKAKLSYLVISESYDVFHDALTLQIMYIGVIRDDFIAKRARAVHTIEAFQSSRKLAHHLGEQGRSENTLPSKEDINKLMNMAKNNSTSMTISNLKDSRLHWTTKYSYIWLYPRNVLFDYFIDENIGIIKHQPEIFHVYVMARYGVEQNYLPWHFSEESVTYITTRDGVPLREKPLGNDTISDRIPSKGTKVDIDALTYNIHGNLWALTSEGYAIYTGNLEYFFEEPEPEPEVNNLTGLVFQVNDKYIRVNLTDYAAAYYEESELYEYLIDGNQHPIIIAVQSNEKYILLEEYAKNYFIYKSVSSAITKSVVAKLDTIELSF